MRLSSIGARLSILYAAAAVVVFALIGLYFERVIVQHFDALDAAELERKIALAQRVFAPSEKSLELRAEHLAMMLGERHGLALVVMDREGRDLFISASDPQVVSALRKAADSANLGSETHIAFTPQRVVVMTATLEGDPGLRVAAAKDGHDHEHFTEELRFQFWTAILFGVLTLGGTGALIARLSLRPVKAIAEKAHSITAHRLDSRIDVGTVPDELRELVQSFNDMLDRLANDFQRLSDFSADLSHELRTPLSNLVTQTQVALGRLRNLEEYQELLASNLEEFERMSRMISDMLFLAKTDRGVAVRAQAHRLDETVVRVVEYYGVLADEKQVRFEVDGQAEIWGDPGLIERLVANIVSNAVRHAEAGSVIEMNIRPDAKQGWVVLTIANAGEEIPAAQLERIFDRFFRADPARHGSAEHAGLGLAIAQSIARAHGGEISAVSCAGRTSFQVVFPTPERRGA